MGLWLWFVLGLGKEYIDRKEKGVSQKTIHNNNTEYWELGLARIDLIQGKEEKERDTCK